ncbi:alpha/beta hydrolase [Mesorhizobium sp. CAU 1732]|uniref:alpha/beta hydrolase n=1 Tax=Mesorhizobium sp. CAU 1732 TaxID=3140358 RepID=UPI003260D554
MSNSDTDATSPGVGRGRIVKRVLAAIGVLGAMSVAALAVVPEHILYRQRLLFSILDLKAEAPLQALDYRTYDGLTLRSWYIPPRDDRPMIVFFAGRDGDILRKPQHLMELTKIGYGLILVGYRGYGGNPGWPNEADMYLDASSLLVQARDAGLEGTGFVLYGYSMGSAFAANAAAHSRPLALILEAPISNFLDAVRQQAGLVPSWLVRTRFDNVTRVSEVQAPVLLMAGGQDAITPPWFALSLAAANPNFAQVKVFEEANHFSIIRLGGRNTVADFLAEIEKRNEQQQLPTA